MGNENSPSSYRHIDKDTLHVLGNHLMHECTSNTLVGVVVPQKQYVTSDLINFLFPVLEHIGPTAL